MQRSQGGTAGLMYLFPHPAHFEMFPEIKCRLNGEVSSAIVGGPMGGAEGGGIQEGGDIQGASGDTYVSH